MEAMKLAASFVLGLFLSFSSLSFNCAVMYLNDICASEAFPAIETTKYLFIWYILGVFLSPTIDEPSVACLSPAITMPSLQTIPTVLVPVFIIFFFKSSSIL